MNFDYVKFVTDPFVLIFMSVISGLIIGKFQYKRIKLGNSGGLFTGLFIGWFTYKKYVIPYTNDSSMPTYVEKILSNGLVPKELFLFTLICFIASVGLLASTDIGTVIKKYGFKFMLLGLLITLTGALSCYAISLLNKDINIFALSGVYVGALTSSPGLAAALESVSSLGKGTESMVGLGYAIGYIPGVIVVIFAMQLLPIIFKIDIEKEKISFIHEMDNKKKKVDLENLNFEILPFLFVCIVGFFIGQIKIYLGPTINYFSLGSTGGVLVSALILGHIGQLGFMNFRMNAKILSALRDLTLSIFLSIVGLRYGYSTLTNIKGEGFILLFVALVCSLFAVLIGFLIGRYVLKINWIMLSGAICGGMTSTPGLGAAIDSSNSDYVATGYGASYPFALFGMIVFTILLQRTVI